MKINTILFIGTLLLGYSAVATSAKTRGSSSISSSRTGRNSPLLCLVVQAHEMQESGTHEYLECELIVIHQEHATLIPGLRIHHLPDDLVKSHLEALHRGEWFVNITGATLEESHVQGHGMMPNAVVLPHDKQAFNVVTVPPEEGRLHYLQSAATPDDGIEHRRLQSTGTRSLLVLRVSVTDSSPTFTASQLAQYYFDPNNFSLVRQYNWCSFGALQFTSYDIAHPVVDVFVPGNVANFTNSQLWPLAFAVGALQKNVTQLTSLAQHIAIVLPPGLGGSNWYAVGTVGFWRTVYNDIYGGYPNIVMHELGHNLGMGHAGVGADPYADSSDIMGYGDAQQFGVTKCFNGFHAWYLKWFASKSLEVLDPYTHKVLTLAAFADYNLTKASDQYVVIKVDAYHLIYNRAKGINAGVNDAIDMVTVAQAQAGVFSLRVAVLDDTTAAFQVANFGGGSLPLIIKVCSMTNGNVVDFAVVSIGVGVSDCSTAVATPTAISLTSAPTLVPTPAPSAPPTLTPTRRPTSKPTLKPTLRPTTRPTVRPTKRPTTRPTLPLARRRSPI